MTTIFPNLNEEEFEGSGMTFPATEECLFVGGPKHAQRLEVVAGDALHKVIAPAADLSGQYVVTSYLRRDLGLTDDEGGSYTRPVYVHEEVTHPQMAQQMIMSALLAEFVKGGQKVTTDGGVSERP